MAPWKLPPRAKVFEAFTAVADGRVRLTGPGSATVTSSGGDKTYDVEWSDDGRMVTANDNASYWQGYLGYPILAVLLVPRRAPRRRGRRRRPWPASPGTTSTSGTSATTRRPSRTCSASWRTHGGDPALVEREVAAVLEQLDAPSTCSARTRRRPPAAKG